ncbi:MAG: 6-phosphogluconolactonase [Methylococcales bacterium]|nr:6-phosphogluconolactonase [Methylococcales bacterium]
MQTSINWHRFDTADSVATAVYHHIMTAAQQAIAERGAFKLVLAGGTTPEKVYRLLADTQADWSNWHIYYGDERCLPVNHPDRNSVMAELAFLQKVAIPREQIFTIPAELNPEIAAQQYQQTVATALPFDMVLLGMGEDGHTASLFPNHHHDENELAHAVYNSPKPPPERVSLSAKALSNTQQLLFLITGANKQDAVKAWRAGVALPVATIVPENPIDVYIDSAADKELVVK